MRVKTLWGLALSVLLFSIPWVPAKGDVPKPNLIYILTDDLGIGDIGPYGQTILSTPHLDRLAKEGLKLERHYAESTVCAPSRGVLLTGLHTGHSAIRGNGKANLPDDALTVPKLLKAQGYFTAAVGKYGLGKPLRLDEPRFKGFDHFYGYVGTSHAHNQYPEYLIRNGKAEKLDNGTIPGTSKDAKDYRDSDIPTTGTAPANHRNQWASQLLADEVQHLLSERAKTKQPFFLYYALNLPHVNNEATQHSSLGHGLESPTYGEFADRDWPAPEKGFAQFIRFIDNEVGKILDQLDALGLSENTVVMFSSDNGPHTQSGHDPEFFNSNGSYRGIKRDLTDGGIRVPFLVRWKGQIAPGTVSQHVSGFQDLLPTVAELSGAAIPTGIDGISMLPALLGKAEQQPQHPYLFWHFEEQGGKQAVLQWPFKLIHTKTGIIKARHFVPRPWQEREVELYHLENDPSESKNLAKHQPALVSRLEALMKEAYVEPTR